MSKVILATVFLLFLFFSVHVLPGEAAPSGPGQVLDVSNHQGTINWQKVTRNKKISGAYLKLTEGVDYRDSYTTEGRLQAMKKADLRYGFYHFLRPRKRDAGLEAEYFAAEIKELGGAGDFWPTVDIETTKLGPKATTNYLERFLEVFFELDVSRKVLLYSSPRWWEQNVAIDEGLRTQLKRVRPWIAHWGRKVPDPLLGLKGYALHQFTSKGKVRGIKGRVDKNRTPDISRILKQD